MDPYGYTDNNNEKPRGRFSNQYPHPEVMIEQQNVQNNPSCGGSEYPMGQPQVPRKNGFWPGFLAGFMVTLLLVVGIWSAKSIYSNIFGSKEAMAGKGDAVTTSEAFKKIQKIEGIIDDYYYKEEDIDAGKMQDGMYAGLVDSLGDPYSVYYNEEELTELLESTEGIYYGIGAYMTTDKTTNCAMVTGTIADTPAEEAGLRPGDLVMEVDGENVQGLTLDEVVAKVRGNEGTSVHLTIYREGESDFLEFDITRRKVESPTVTYEMLEQDIGYIQITEFDDVTTDQFTDAYATIKGSNAKGLIIDLRGNPGGNVDTVVSIARQLLPEGLIFYTENKTGKREEYSCDGKNEIQIPLVVLVDSYSASASEILSGAVKDYGIGKLVGTTTFGKGIVQRVISLSDGTALKLTESAYYTPSGKNIHGIGIDPDVEIAFDGDAYYNDGIDNQLEKGKEVLLDMMR